jgi:hypothetical protein
MGEGIGLAALTQCTDMASITTKKATTETCFIAISSAESNLKPVVELDPADRMLMRLHW